MDPSIVSKIFHASFQFIVGNLSVPGFCTFSNSLLLYPPSAYGTTQAVLNHSTINLVSIAQCRGEFLCLLPPPAKAYVATGTALMAYIL